MREIKFRAWHKTSGAWLNDNISIAMSGAKQYQGKPIGAMLQGLELNIEYMQYTCLKVKNGEEIYEGDIIKQKLHNEDIIFEIIFEYGMFKAKKKHVSFALIIACENDHNHNCPMEIIGNIYENPELLKDK